MRENHAKWKIFTHRCFGMGMEEAGIEAEDEAAEDAETKADE